MKCYKSGRIIKKTGEFPKWWRVYQTGKCSCCDKYFINEMGSSTDVDGNMSGSGSIYEISSEEHKNILASGEIPKAGSPERANWHFVKEEHYNYED